MKVARLMIPFSAFLLMTLTLVSFQAMAHEHTVVNPNHTQVIANGQLHPGFDKTLSCEDGTEGPAWYGLETAHHGPDSGIPGKGDGCYETDTWPPGTDDRNPAID